MDVAITKEEILEIDPNAINLFHKTTNNGTNDTAIQDNDANDYNNKDDEKLLPISFELWQTNVG